MSMFDKLIALGVFFVGAVTLVVTFIFWGYIQTVVALFKSPEYATLIDPSIAGLASNAADQGLNLIRMFDGFGVFLLFVMAFVIIVSSAMIKTHPIFVVPAMLLMVLEIIVAGFLADSYYTIVTATPQLAAAAENFPYTLYVFQNLPKITLIISLLATIAAYGKIPGLPTAQTEAGGEI